MSPAFRNRFCRVIIVSLLELFLLGCSAFLAAQPGDVASGADSGVPPLSPLTATQASQPSPAGDQAGNSPPADNAFSGAAPDGSAGETSYENTTLTEDVTWRGTVLVRGYLVIASQATVRIEPGTVVRFMKSSILRQMPRLVVMGRIDVRGLPGRPVLFAPGDAVGGDAGWEGILLLSSEKRNRLEHVRIEGAVTGIEARFSNFSMTDATVIRSRNGMFLRDSVAKLVRVTLERCDTGLEALDSELDLRDGTFVHSRRGVAAVRSTLEMQEVKVKESERFGIDADECRIRMVSCEIAGNRGGVHLRGGVGQIAGSRFVGNREVGLDLVSSRIMIRQSLFADTRGDAVRLEDGQSAIWESSFMGNSGYNLANRGRENVSAVRNWWGSAGERDIAAKLHDGARNSRYGRIDFFPWLPEKPGR